MTTNIQKSLRRALQAVALFAFVFAIAMNVNTNVDGTIDVNMETADAQIAVPIPIPICLIGQLPGTLQVRQRVCKCFRDVIGAPDVFVGYQIKCVAIGNGCYLIRCLTGGTSCYCV